MKIITEKEVRWLTTENENNYLLDVLQKDVLDKRLILAKSITSENVNDFFREITPEEAEKINTIKQESEA